MNQFDSINLIAGEKKGEPPPPPTLKQNKEKENSTKKVIRINHNYIEYPCRYNHNLYINFWLYACTDEKWPLICGVVCDFNLARWQVYITPYSKRLLKIDSNCETRDLELWRL